MFKSYDDCNKPPSNPLFKGEVTSNSLPIKADNDDDVLLSGQKNDQMSVTVICALETRKKVKTFIIDNFLFGDESGLENDTSFLDVGIIDSTGVLELISFLEDHFKIQIEDAEVIPENLDSIEQVTAFLERKMGVEP
jgi:acyl carrier protein